MWPPSPQLWHVGLQADVASTQQSAAVPPPSIGGGFLSDGMAWLYPQGLPDKEDQPESEKGAVLTSSLDPHRI